VAHPEEFARHSSEGEVGIRSGHGNLCKSSSTLGGPHLYTELSRKWG